MSSLTRRIQLKNLRKAKKINVRHKAVNKLKGTPFRNCKVFFDTNGNVSHWIRYH